MGLNTNDSQYQEGSMLNTVIAFAVILMAFEFVLLCMVPPKLRLRLLGNEAAKVAVSMGMLLINLTVHWGTATGTMSATLSFVTSLLTLWIASKVFGKIVDDRYYTVGFIKYSAKEIT